MGGADYKTSGITRESGTKIRKFETEGGKRAKANRQTNRQKKARARTNLIIMPKYNQRRGNITRQNSRTGEEKQDNA